MAVKQQRGSLRAGGQPLAVDHRIAGGGHDGDLLQADAGHGVGQPLRRALDGRLSFGQGADAGNAQEIVQGVQVVLALQAAVGDRL